MGKKRRLISFDRDIIDDVVRLSEGKYTRKQVEWCMKASVSYIHHLLKYTDSLVVCVPFLGEMICNVREMRVRRDKIRRIFVKNGNKYPDDRMPIELECLERKIKMIEDMGEPERGDPLTKHNHQNMYKLRHNMTWEELQDFQREQFIE